MIIRYIFLFLFLCVSVSNTAQANQPSLLPDSGFSTLPVLHEGRLKPLSSFANIMLQDFSGGRTGKIEPSAWLAEVIFDPAQALERPIFALPDRKLADMMDLPEDQKLFTWAELAPGLQATQMQALTLLTQDTAELTELEIALLTLHDNTEAYTQLLRSFSMVIPIGPDEKTYLNINPADPQHSDALGTIAAGARGNSLLRVIPSGDAQEPWVSPWAVINQGYGGPHNKAMMDGWFDLATAYRSGDAGKWGDTIATVKEQSTQAGSSPFLLHLEHIYKSLPVYDIIIGLYALAFAALMISQRFAAAGLIGGGLAFAGIVGHGAAITARSLILQRPPVGTLYESVLFVALVCALIGIIVHLVNHSKNNGHISLITGLVAAVLLLLTAPYILRDSDSLDVLVAVLNTNFWLTTHVLCITAGYGACIITALLAHGALWQRSQKASASSLHALCIKMAVLALLLTAVGTALGGIWADQSWGRFWGWDPKENGALLIVLWLAWLFHGLHSGLLTRRWFEIGLGFLTIIVAIAWFGVNLLNTGLHSYGFIEGLAGSLAAFCLVQIFVLAILMFKTRP